MSIVKGIPSALAVPVHDPVPSPHTPCASSWLATCGATIVGMPAAASIMLVPEFTYTVRTTQPLGPADGSPHGRTQYWQVSEAELHGDRIHGRLAAPGSDWMRMTPDGFWRPDVQAAFVTDTDELILMHYTGLVEQTDAFKAAAEQDRETEFMRLVLTFDTGAGDYQWLTRSVFIAAGRLLGTGRIEYAVHRVT